MHNNTRTFYILMTGCVYRSPHYSRDQRLLAVSQDIPRRVSREVRYLQGQTVAHSQLEGRRKKCRLTRQSRGTCPYHGQGNKVLFTSLTLVSVLYDF